MFHSSSAHTSFPTSNKCQLELYHINHRLLNVTSPFNKKSTPRTFHQCEFTGSPHSPLSTDYATRISFLYLPQKTSPFVIHSIPPSSRVEKTLTLKYRLAASAPEHPDNRESINTRKTFSLSFFPK